MLFPLLLPIYQCSAAENGSFWDTWLQLQATPLFKRACRQKERKTGLILKSYITTFKILAAIRMLNKSRIFIKDIIPVMKSGSESLSPTHYKIELLYGYS